MTKRRAKQICDRRALECARRSRSTGILPVGWAGILPAQQRNSGLQPDSADAPLAGRLIGVANV